MQRKTVLLARAASVIVSLGILLPQTVTVSIAAALPNLTVGPTTLSFTYQIGGTIPAAQTIAVASGASSLSYTALASGASWLTALPVSGTTPGSISVSVSPQGLTAGAYSGDVIIEATGVGNAPQIVMVSLRVIDPTAPQLTATPSPLTFSYTIGGTAPAAQSVSIGASGSALSYTVSASGGTWLAATPASGAPPASASVSVDTTGLAPGTYTGSVSIAVLGGGNTPLVVPVSLAVTASLPNLTVSPTTLSFTYQIGGAIPAAQTVSAVASDGPALSYTASASGGGWLTALPVSGTTPGSVSVAISPQGLTAGVYSADVIFQATGAGNAPQIVTVSLTVIDPTAPQLTASPSSLTFNYTYGTPGPAAQSISIGTTGSALSYMVSAYGVWLAVKAASGATPGIADVSVDTTGLAPGTYTGSMSITATGAGNTPLIVPVSLSVVTRPRPRVTTRASLAATGASTVPNLVVSPISLSFTYQIGGAIPAAQTVSTVASDGSALSYTASASGDSWLTALPVNGTTPGSVSVSISPQGLTAGVYTGHMIVASPGAANLPQVVTVSLTVVGSPAPTLTATPASLAFSYQAGGPAPPAQALTIGSSGSVLGYTVSASGGAWLGVTPTSGNTLGSVGVFVNTSGLAVGTYSGSITIAAAGVGNTPLTVPVTLTVTAGNLFTTLYSANFSYIIGGPVQSLPTVSVGSTGSALSYTVSAPSWLAVTPTTGTTPGSLSVSVNTTGLTVGTYNGSVTIAAPGAGNSPLTVPESLTVVNPSIVPSQSSLTFNYPIGGTAPGAQSLSISSTGAALSYTVSASGGTWLSVSPTSGTTPGSVSVSVNITGLAVGTYSGSLTIAAAGAANTPVTVPVTLRVTLPALTTTPNSLTFSYTTGGTAPAAQSVSITSNGSPLSYTVSASATWLAVTPTSGTTPGSVSVSINTTGLTAGTYTGSVTITSSGASNSPRTVSVTLTVT
jgi:hypothetical protein